MAIPKKPGTTKSLSFIEIIMGADAETIKAAYEAKIKIDGLLAERAEAYRRIAEIEEQIETVVGDPGTFIYPPPPMVVAGWPKLEAQPHKAEPAAAPKPAAAPRKEKPAAAVAEPKHDEA